MNADILKYDSGQIVAQLERSRKPLVSDVGSTVKKAKVLPLSARQAPARRIRQQLCDSLKKLGVPRSSMEKTALGKLAEVGLPQPEALLDKFPFQLSGGMAQRVTIALSACSSAKLVIADEPTNGLDHADKLGFLKLLSAKYSDNVLDIGAGMGGYSVEFARVSASVTALDINRDCLAVLQKRATECGLSNIRCVNSPWKKYTADRKFDVSFSAMCPAICNQEVLLRLERMTRRTVCLLAVTRGAYEKCRMELMRRLPLKKPGGMVTEALHYYKMCFIRWDGSRMWNAGLNITAFVPTLSR